MLPVSQVCVGIFSLFFLAFIAGGMNAIYQIEQIPLMWAILIHGGTLYISYLATYLINDWLEQGIIPVLVDPEAECVAALRPDAVVDAILAKKNLGTTRDMAKVVVAVGPGFTAGEDCHAVVETMRGHTLGRVNYAGSALPNTGIPGLIGGFSGERVLRAPCDGIFHALRQIGDQVNEGEIVGEVEGMPMTATITGVLRGILPDGTPVTKGMKSGDVDPRCQIENCFTASDKALAVGGGVLEAVMALSSEKGSR